MPMLKLNIDWLSWDGMRVHEIDNANETHFIVVLTMERPSDFLDMMM